METPPPTPFKVQAVYSWGGEDKSQDLGFMEGDIIEVLRVYQDAGTYYGKSLRTKLFGKFPARYAKQLHLSVSQRGPSPPVTTAPPASSPFTSMRYSRLNSSTPNVPSGKAFYSSLGNAERSQSSQSIAQLRQKGHRKAASANTHTHSRERASTTSAHHRKTVSANTSRESALYNRESLIGNRYSPHRSNASHGSHGSSSSSPESSDIFSLRQNNYSFSDFEDQQHPKSVPNEDEEFLQRLPALPPLPPKHKYEKDALAESLESLRASRSSLNSSHSSSHSSSGRGMRSSYVQHLMELSTNTNDTHESSTFGYSDLSATSAGSYMRHKEAHQAEEAHQRQRQEKKPLPATPGALFQSDRQELFDKMFEEDDKSRHPNFFRKLLKSSRNDGPSLDDQIFRESRDKLAGLSLRSSELSLGDSLRDSLRDSLGPLESLGPVETPADKSEVELERVKTLSGTARARRKSRALGEDPELILQPHRFLTSVNKNEVVPGMARNMGLDSTPLTHVDRFIDQLPSDRYASLKDIVQQRIDGPFNTKLEKLRAIYTFLATKFELVPPPMGEKLSTKIMPDGENMKDIIYNGQCTAHQLTWLFFLMAHSLKIEAAIVLGHLKAPLEYDDQDLRDAKGMLTLNHSWISVLIDGEFRLVDVALGNPTNPTFTSRLPYYDSIMLGQHFDFYFLAKPLDLVYTHVPLHVDNQHVTPPLEPIAQLALPPLYPAFIMNGLRLYKFNQAIFRLCDFEVIDFDIEIPADFDVKAVVQPLDTHSYAPQRAFIQKYTKSGRHLAKIKTTLPPNCAMAFICCYGRTSEGLVGREDFAEDPLEGLDGYSLLLSVPCFHRGKFSEVSWVQLNPLPDSRDIYVKEPQIGSLALGSSYGFVVQTAPLHEDDFRSVLISPSGHFSELERIDRATWEVRETLREKGEWRLAVPNEQTGKWHLHAKWVCN